MSALIGSAIFELLKRQTDEDADPEDGGMAAGLVIKLTEGTFIQNTVSFDYQFFFNLLLPPIILASGYELHQANFFRNIGTILTFAFAGTFISAVVLGLFLWLWTRIPLDGFSISFVEAISVGATLSATDPVTILAIFNTYKVDPKLYTVIFGESILNDAIAIVIFDTAQRYKPDGIKGGSLTIADFFEAIGIFFLVFFGSLIIGVIVGIGTALLLKFTLVRRFPKIESCLVILIAYASYYFANGAMMSGLCLAINWFIRYRAKRRGKDVADELPYSYQVMLFWAGLRGAVGVALAAGLTGANGPTLQATVLVVVVLTVIIFGGTTARMLEIMGIRTGVVEELDSDDEFDIETATNGTYYKSGGNAVGYLPQRKSSGAPNGVRINGGSDSAHGSYSSGTPSVSPPNRPTSRNNSTVGQRERDVMQARQSLLARGDETPSDEEFSDSDLPPAARTRPPKRKPSPPRKSGTAGPSHTVTDHGASSDVHLSASGAISQLLSGTADEQAAWFTQLDEGFIKPKLLLDQNRKGGGV
ncbi:hypothetical protein P7C71_g833, partial [Lecanoromycetidae sp. Uapishka_2]